MRYSSDESRTDLVERNRILSVSLCGAEACKGKNAVNDERSIIQKRIDDLSAQRATAARVLDWLESDASFEEVYGSDSRDRHAARERERIARLDVQITGKHHGTQGSSEADGGFVEPRFSLAAKWWRELSGGAKETAAEDRRIEISEDELWSGPRSYAGGGTWRGPQRPDPKRTSVAGSGILSKPSSVILTLPASVVGIPKGLEPDL